MLQTHDKREARSVKRFSIGIHVSLGIARETTRDEAIFPNFNDESWCKNCVYLSYLVRIFKANVFSMASGKILATQSALLYI